MNFLCTAIPKEMPEWCQVASSNDTGQFNCKLDIESKYLQEELQQTANLQDMLESLGFTEITWVKGKIRVIPDSPLAPLNKLFPEGIPTRCNSPSILMRDERCYEFDTNGVPREVLKQIIQIAEQDKMPFDIIMGLTIFHVLAIPSTWVVPQSTLALSK